MVAMDAGDSSSDASLGIGSLAPNQGAAFKRLHLQQQQQQQHGWQQQLLQQRLRQQKPDAEYPESHLAFALFEVCLALKEFDDYQRAVPKADRRNLAAFSTVPFHQWFTSGFSVWLGVVEKIVRQPFVVLPLLLHLDKMV